MNTPSPNNIIAHKRKNLATMTPDERKGAMKDFVAHVKICEEAEVEHVPWIVYVVEWLEVSRQKEIEPEADNPTTHDARDYNRRFEGLTGFD
jgi:hypothetical protein